MDTYLLRLAPALEHKDVGKDVFHLKPAGEREGRIRPHPVHKRSQLQQERDDQESKITREQEILDKYGLNLRALISHID